MSELPEYTIADLQTAFDRGEQTAVGLCEAFLQRRSEIDTAGPTLASVIEVNPDALASAEARRTRMNRCRYTYVPYKASS